MKHILTAWIIAGTMDAVAAVLVYSVVLQKASVLQIFQGIASGVMGAKAFEGGTVTGLMGLAIHYLIAFCWAIFYFFIYTSIKFLKKNKIVSGLLYGLFVWVIMNIIVLPVTFNRAPDITISNFLTGSIILMIAIGLPISFIADNYFKLPSKQQVS